MSEVDDLFGAAGDAPTPRTGLVWSLLTSGLLLTLAGLACTSAPGGVLVLLAWLVVEKEVDRVESGYLPADVGPQVRQLQTITMAGLALVLLAFTIQFFLLAAGVYDAMFDSLLLLAADWVGTGA